jgi:hypothetical protein
VLLENQINCCEVRNVDDDGDDDYDDDDNNNNNNNNTSLPLKLRTTVVFMLKIISRGIS